MRTKGDLMARVGILLLMFCSFVGAKESSAECGQNQFIVCLNEMRAGTPPSESCRQMREYERKNPFHWEGTRYHEHEEWKIRQELDAIGLRVDYKTAPVDYVKSIQGDKEIVALFEPADWGDDEDLGRRYSLVVFGGNLKLHRCEDPGVYPWNVVLLYGRKLGEKDWKAMGTLAANAVVARDGPNSPRLSRWFDESVPVDCPRSKLLRGEAGICFTYLTKGDWPQAHVWNDHLGSTGILMDSYRWEGGKWRRWEHDGGSRFSVQSGQTLLIHKLFARYEKWLRVDPGVQVVEARTGKFFPSAKWTRMLLKPFQVTGIAEAPEISEPGFYCFGRTAPFNGYYDDCVELIKRESGQAEVILADPPEAKITLIVGSDFRHLTLVEKQALITMLPGILSSASWRRNNQKFEEHPIDRFDRLLIEYATPLEITHGAQTLLIKRMTVPFPDRESRDPLGVEFGAFYVDGWSGRISRPAATKLFCGETIDFVGHQPVVAMLCDDARH